MWHLVFGSRRICPSLFFWYFLKMPKQEQLNFPAKGTGISFGSWNHGRKWTKLVKAIKVKRCWFNKKKRCWDKLWMAWKVIQNWKKSFRISLTYCRRRSQICQISSKRWIARGNKFMLKFSLNGQSTQNLYWYYSHLLNYHYSKLLKKIT